MNRRQVDRAVLAQRAARRSAKPKPVLAPSTGQSNRPSTDLTARVLTEVKPSGVGIRKSRTSMTGAQRNSEGRRSEWSRSPYYRTGVTVDSRWSA